MCEADGERRSREGRLPKRVAGAVNQSKEVRDEHETTEDVDDGDACEDRAKKGKRGQDAGSGERISTPENEKERQGGRDEGWREGTVLSLTGQRRGAKVEVTRRADEDDDEVKQGDCKAADGAGGEPCASPGRDERL